MSIAGGLEKSFARGEEVGCETMQIFTKSSNQWQAKELTDNDIERWQAALAASPITPVIAHDSYLINLASPTEELLVKSREAFLVEVERCERLAIPCLVMHPGAHKDAGEQQGLQTIAESFDWVHRQTPGLQVKVLLETTAGQGSSLGHSFAQLRQIIDSVEEGDRLGVCLDTCHVFAAGYDITTREGYEATIDELDTVIGLERLRAIHLNDSKKPLGSRVDRHEHIGKGALGLEPFRMLLNDRRLTDVPMILETPKGKDNAEDLDNLATLRSLLDER
jgi:deoxyribonuclease-4